MLYVTRHGYIFLLCSKLFLYYNIRNFKLKLILLIVPCVCLTNAFADVSEDRLNTYKGNKLIPQEVEIATMNSVASESAGVAVFNPSDLSWRSYNNAQSAVLGKYMDWIREDFEAFFADSANKAGFADAWNFLSQVGNKHVAGTAISSDDSMEVLQTQFDNMYTNGTLSGTAFPCEGIDFSGKYICDLDLSNFTGVLPKIDLSGINLSGKYLSGVDFSQCVRLTGTQLASAADISNIKLSSPQYETLKYNLPRGLHLYVDGVSTVVPNRFDTGGTN